MKTYSEIVMPVAMKTGAIIGLCYIFSIVLPMVLGFVGSLIGLFLLFAPIMLLYNSMKTLSNDFSPVWTNGRKYSANLVSIQLVNFGTITFLLAGMIYALFIYVYLTYINPQYLNESIALASKLFSEKFTVEEMSLVQQDLNSITPSSMIVSSIFFFSFIGLVISVLMVVWLRVKRNFVR